MMFRIASSLLALLCLGSCAEDVVLYGDGERLPVVYCLLDMEQDRQFVRVGFTYQADNQSGLIAPAPDTVPWTDSLVIYMEEWDSLNPVKIHQYSHAPEIMKNEGWFPDGFSRVYSSLFRPKPATRYQLYVYFPGLDKMITAGTKTLTLPELLDPEVVPGRKITFHQETPFTLRYNSFDEQGTFQSVFRLHYTEERDSTVTQEYADLVSPVFVESRPMIPAQHPINGNEFFQAMAREIKPDSTVRRKVLSLECIFNSAGPEIGFILDPNRNDMGSAGTVYSFSNVSSGAGVFSSRFVKRLTDIELSEITIDSLAGGKYTRHLNFLDHTGK